MLRHFFGCITASRCIGASFLTRMSRTHAPSDVSLFWLGCTQATQIDMLFGSVATVLIMHHEAFCASRRLIRFFRVATAPALFYPELVQVAACPLSQIDLWFCDACDTTCIGARRDALVEHSQSPSHYSNLPTSTKLVVAKANEPIWTLPSYFFSPTPCTGQSMSVSLGGAAHHGGVTSFWERGSQTPGRPLLASSGS
jgi:hypothetical protein